MVKAICCKKVETAVWIVILSLIAGGECKNVRFANVSVPLDPCDKRIHFECADNSQGLSMCKFCDGIKQCKDGGDEIRYNATLQAGLPGRACTKTTVNGTMATCYIPQFHVCNNQVDCYFGNDECNCTTSLHCIPRPGDPKTCRVRAQFCNLVPNCPSGSDELKYAPGLPGLQCAVTKLSVRNHCMLPQVHVCDGINDCDEGTDECFCNSTGIAKNSYIAEHYLYNMCFRCLDDSSIVNVKRVCDMSFNCRDLSDECLCLRKRPPICNQVCQYGQKCGNCTVGQVLCSGIVNGNKKCINRSQVCDKIIDCPNREDENNCPVINDPVFNCADGLQSVQKYMHCDRYPDCSDGSDEWNCSSMYKCKTHRKSRRESRPGAFSFERPGYATKCDNIIECSGLDDECNKTLCPNSTVYACRYVKLNKKFVCPNSSTVLPGKTICDGYPTCNSASPELSADEFNCTNRLYCADHGKSGLPIHIRLSQRCNQITDCNDVSDEMGCNTTTNFYCPSGTPKYVPRYKVCNGVHDCRYGEDECQNCATSPFSSDKFLISSYFLQVVVWVTGICAIFGNVAVIVHNARQMWITPGSKCTVAFINRMLTLNLATADLLLGIYIISLGIVNLKYAQIYCRRDMHWRGSIACSALGCLAVISTEMSVFTLSIMASYRLLLVYRPFSAGKRPRVVALVAAMAWITAIMIAIAPLLSYQRDFFVSGLWYRRNKFLAAPNRTSLAEFVTALRTFQDPVKQNFTAGEPKALTYASMISTVARLGPELVPRYYFGFYSVHGVCLPRFFPIPAIDRSWVYSFVIICINFCAFIYMAVAYIIIYRKSQATARRAGRDNPKCVALQRKIFRIVITNFCCWMPICVMAFISVSGVHFTKTAYSVTAIAILPINSATNPFLYSGLPDKIWAKLASPFRERLNSLMSENEQKITLRVRGSKDSGRL